ncbi:MipA/OmpV family protein [Undibacterium sp. TJN19]|uniref:MipA/OmpV family protein n=1 Tax=Undibacterium sp. TJN19 TaxID=3413055 RepID=UPI003BF0336F
MHLSTVRNIIAALLATVSVPCLAQVTHMMMPEDTQDIDFGVAAVVAPSAEGSSGRRFFVLPFASVQWSNGVFLAPGEIGIRLPAPVNSQYGLMLAYGVKPDRIDNTNDAKINAEPGGFYNYQFAQQLGIKSRLAFGGGDQHRGARMELGAWASTALTSHQSASAEVGLQLADHAYMQSYFGVSAAQAGHGPYRLYDAASGVKNTYLNLNWRTELSLKYELSLRLGLNRLYGSAASSPLVSQRNTVSVMSAISYHY